MQKSGTLDYVKQHNVGLKHMNVHAGIETKQPINFGGTKIVINTLSVNLGVLLVIFHQINLRNNFFDSNKNVCPNNLKFD